MRARNCLVDMVSMEMLTAPALIRKPSNGVLTMEIQFKDVSSEARKMNHIEL